MSTSLPSSGLSIAARYAVPFALLLIPLWKTRVSAMVPESYLDEAFHVPQAQAYWAHQWTHWDPKITTPPGLYLWSYLVCAAMHALRGSPTELNADALRTTNVVGAAVLLPWRLQSLLDTVRKQRNDRPAGARLSHTVLNICLFPPLFFFSGLYYTDVLALLVVIEAYNWELKRVSSNTFSLLRSLMFVVFGLAALVFRQTNIFWVSVFLGGLQALRTVRLSSSPCKSTGLIDVAKKGFQNEFYDPYVSEASVADYFKTATSIATVGLKNLGRLVVSTIPHITILAVFSGFVLWNNGVVMGHKEYHTAGLHLPQMLYIWPFFFFFSWPILLISIINALVPKISLPDLLDYGFPQKMKRFPDLLAIFVTIPVMLAVIHFNTIVHPFTLADNRHYVFYAFRILRSHSAVTYGAAAVYFLGAWAVLSAFGFSMIAPPPRLMPVPQPKPQAPAQPIPRKEQRRQQKEESKQTRAGRKQAASQRPNQAEQNDPVSPEVLARIQKHIATREKKQLQPTKVSFVIIWLTATALSLITAPLVEPRYFIIPWVMWRLHLPPHPMPAVFRQQQFTKEGDIVRAQVATYAPLFLETLWFLVINAVTGYVFLYKGFEWPQEPGRIQRFMW